MNVSATSGPITMKFYQKHHWDGGKAALGFGPEWTKTLVSMATDSSHSIIMEKTVLPLFIPRHFKKCRVLCYTLHSKICVRVSGSPSVCPSVHPSVSASFQLSARCIFQPIFFKLGIRVDIGKECLWIADG